ncbi:unnamed protein product [Colletotrichum noveboracense]|uniref:Uncharacterized protein n=1 Tax=Colletotrichum noveboracense TaxID=2664923 RepID=A0A9W4S3A9_9PEZI|nr:unnamed protein product [Colletotrichum noveboracense]
MAALPPNWEWDYDGTRWFYRYKPNGHVQFHFPKEGDEFPDFFDAMSPIPDLSPEEKLESQQQMKRRTGGDPDPKSKMSATGGPLADFGMNRSGFGGPLDDDDGAEFFYQPENLMYLGPGAYTDISPLADEDERDEIPRDRRKSRDSASPKKERTTLELAGSDKTGVSPLQSETNTPSVKNSVPVRESTTVPESVTEEAVLIINTQELPGPSQPAIPSPGVLLLDSVEKPRPTAAPPVQSPPWDPVGFVAEMATEHTAPAHIETHPDPVEMGDNAVLAPIETRIMDPGIAELPEWTSPSDAKPPVPSTHDLLHQTSMSDHALYGATFGTGSRPQNSSPTNSGKVRTSTRPLAVPPKLPLDDSLPEVVPHQTQSSTSTPTTQPFSIERKPSKTGPKRGTFKPYVPGSTPNPIPDKWQPKEPDFVRRDHRNSLAREASLMLGPRQSYETSNVPSILQPPQIPPKQPLESTQTLIQRPVNPARPDATRTQTEPAGVLTSVTQSSGPSKGPLQYVPSVLKPARGFFRSADANASPMESATTPVPQRQNPFEIQTVPLRSPASRPASFSAPSPTSTQPTTPGSAGFDTTAGPPEVSGMVSSKPSAGVSQHASGMPGGRAHNVIEPIQSPTDRQHSVPAEVFAVMNSQPLPVQSTSNGSSKYGPQQQQPYQQGQEMPQPHSAQPVPSTSSVGNQPGTHPPYPLEEGQNIPRLGDRPQRPTVTPPTQQLLGPTSPRTPGHILHPIQEHHDSGATNQNVSGTAAFHNTDSSPRASPASVRQMSTGSSQYSSSAESPSGQGNMLGRGNVTSMPQAMSPAVATMGQTYSPVQSNPFQISPTTTRMQPPTQVMRPGSTPQVMSHGKDKEKGGWLSKIMKGSNKPNVLQKPPPSPNTGPASPHSPNTTRPAQGHNTGRVAAQQSNQATYDQQAPAVFQQIQQPITSEPVSRPQNFVPSPAGPILAPPTGGPEPMMKMQQAPAVEAPQVAPRLQVGQSKRADATQSVEQTVSSLPPRGLSPATVAPSEPTADNMSDAASVSAISVSTMDVSEAQAQPVLKPQLVTVEKAPSVPDEHQLPSRVAAASGSLSQSPPRTADPVTSSQPPVDSDLTVEPLFSKRKSIAAAPPVPVMPSAPAANDKWAKKPAVDYSGDDWGDDPWDFA